MNLNKLRYKVKSGLLPQNLYELYLFQVISCSKIKQNFLRMQVSCFKRKYSTYFVATIANCKRINLWLFITNTYRLSFKTQYSTHVKCNLFTQQKLLLNPSQLKSQLCTTDCCKLHQLLSCSKQRNTRCKLIITYILYLFVKKYEYSNLLT